jgi:hypothetical protein
MQASFLASSAEILQLGSEILQRSDLRPQSSGGQLRWAHTSPVMLLISVFSRRRRGLLGLMLVRAAMQHTQAGVQIWDD